MTLVNTGKSIWQNPITFHNKTQKLGIERNFHQLPKKIHGKPTPNLLLNNVRMNFFLWRSRISQGLPNLFNFVSEILAREIMKENEIKSIQIRRENLKIFLVVGDVNLKKATKTQLELTN